MAIIPLTGLAAIDSAIMPRNYRADATGAWRREGNSSWAPIMLAHQVNAALGRNPRTVFSKSHPYAVASAAGVAGSQNPHTQWRYCDGLTNARDMTVRIIALPNETGSSTYSYAHRYGNTGFCTAEWPGNRSYVDTYGDVFETTYWVNRGAAAGTDLTDGLSTVEGFSILNITVEDWLLTRLDTAVHRYVNPALAARGRAVLNDIVDQMVDGQHELARFGRPAVFSWSSLTVGATPAAPGDATGCTVTSGTFVNILDQAWGATVSAVSPGMMIDRRSSAVAAANYRTMATPRVLCRCSGNATVRFYGNNMEVAGDNYVDVAISDTGGAAVWFGSDSDYFQVVAPLAEPRIPDLTTVSKTDVHARVLEGGIDSVTIYVTTAWEVDPYPPPA